MYLSIKPIEKKYYRNQINSVTIIINGPKPIFTKKSKSLLLTLNTIVIDCFAFILDYLKTRQNQAF